MNETIKINFEASAKGLNQIFQDLQKISNGLDLTDKTKESLAKLQVSMPAFMARIQAAMQNQNLNLIDLKELDKEFKGLGKIIEGVIAGIRSSNLSAELSKEIEQAEKKLEQKQKEFQVSRGAVRGQQNKLNANRDSGLARTEENNIFAQATNNKGLEINDTIVQSYEDFVSVLQKARQEGKLTEQQNAELSKIENTLANAMSKRKTQLEQQIAAEKATWSARKESINAEKTNIELLRSKINENTQLTEQEKQLVNQLIAAQTSLGNARTQQANAVDRATKEEKELRDEREKSNASTKNNTTLINQNTKAQQKNTTTIGKAAKQVFTYGTVMSLFRRVYRMAIKTVQDMDKALTDMAVVTSMSRKDAYELTNSFRDLATQTGKTTSEIASMATKFYQQGKSTTQVLQLTEAAARAATIAGIDGSKSIDLLTNAMNGFQIGASKAMEVSDKFAALAASAATDYEELATALSKVAAQANLAGMSMDFTLGLLTKGIETTREAPETIGTALKTVISRMRELTDYGATLEDGIDVNRVDKALQNVGVSLMDTNGQFRNLDAVLTELGQKWDTLNVNQQANVAVALAGTRQQSRLIAMMQDFDRTLELVDISANSYGATMAQSADYMEGLEAATTRMKTAYEGFISTLVNSDLVIGIIDAVTKIGSVLTSIINNAWLMVPIMAILGSMAIKALDNKLTEHRIAVAQQKIANEEIITKNKARSLEIANQLTKLKNYQLALKQAKKDKISLSDSARKLAFEKRQTAENKLQLAIEEEKKGNTAKANKLQNEATQLEAEAATLEEQAAQFEQKQLDIDAELKKTTEEINTLTAEKNKLDSETVKLQAQNSGFLGGIAGTLGSIISLLSIIPGILVTIASVTKIIGKLKDANYRKTLKEIAVEKMKAAWSMAASAANIPFVGWVIAGAILAAIIGGIAIAAAVTSNNESTAKDNISQTREELNQLQADLYNLEQSQRTVSKLADEFENLSNKIIKTDEDLARMSEIAQQINDEAGFDLINGATAKEQLAQIKGYNNLLKEQVKLKKQEINTTLGEGYKDVADRFKQMYMDNVKSDPAFVNSIRTVGLSMINGLSDVAASTQDAILDLLVDNIDAEGVFSTDGVNTTAFENLLAQGYDGGGKGFNSFLTALDETMTSGTMSDYANMWDKMSKDLQDTMGESIPMFKAIQKMGSNTARKFDNLGLSSDELNSVWNTLNKTGKILGKTTDEIASSFSGLADTMLKAGDDTARATAYTELVGQQIEAAKKAKEILDMSEEELKTAKANGDKAAQDYLKAKEDVDKYNAEALKKQQAIKDEEEKKESDSDKIEELQKEEQEAITKAGEAQQVLDDFSDAAKNSSVAIKELQKLLGSRTANEIVEDFTKLASTMERVGKSTNIANLSLKEQIELLAEYPELLSAMEKGYLSVADASKLYSDKANQGVEDIKKSRNNLDVIYKAGTVDLVSSDQWGEYSDIFTDSGTELRNELASAGVIDSEHELVKLLMKKNSDLSVSKALELVQGIQADAIAYNQYEYMLDQYEKGDYTIFMSEAEKEAWQNAKSISAANRSMVESLTSDLEYMDATSEEYKVVFAARNKALNDAVTYSKDRLQEIENIKSDMLAGKIIVGDEEKQFSDYVEFINGTAHLSANAMKDLTDEQIKSLSVIMSSLNAYAEEYKEVSDQIIKDNEARAQAMIDSEAKVLEAQINSLEKRKEAYEKYFEDLDEFESEQDRAQSMEDIAKQLSALAGGSGAATNERKKELMQELEALKEEEASARKEAAREALLNSIDEQIDGLNTQLDAVNDSLNAILQVLSNGEFEIRTDAQTGAVKLFKQDENGKWIEHHFKEGGLVDYTGPAWVDGTTANPEAFLSAADTKNMRALLDAIQLALDNKTLINARQNSVETNNETVHIENVNITTNELNNEQDFRTSGQIFAAEFTKAMKQRGINRNVKK